jgi:type VI secretion system protein
LSGYGSLFERLEGTTTERQNWSLEASAMASVAAHLSKMLSTRAGSVQTLPDYGLPDLNDMRLSLHDALQQARVDIERFINAYEPRLSQVRVEALPRDSNALTLSFALHGQLEVEGFKCQVTFVARLDDRGHIKVSKEKEYVR